MTIVASNGQWKIAEGTATDIVTDLANEGATFDDVHGFFENGAGDYVALMYRK